MGSGGQKPPPHRVLLPPRCACIDVRHAHKASRKWTLEMDVALVQYINRLCRHLAITPARLHPHEVYLDPADTTDPRVACLLSMWPRGNAFLDTRRVHCPALLGSPQDGTRNTHIMRTGEGRSLYALENGRCHVSADGPGLFLCLSPRVPQAAAAPAHPQPHSALSWIL